MRFKYCSACGEKKPLTDEFFDKCCKGSNRYKAMCRDCFARFNIMLDSATQEETPKQKMVSKCIRFMGTVNHRTHTGVSPTDIIGMNASELAEHLLWTFVQNYGCEWDGKCAVDIDHITPLRTRECAEDLFALWNYENLQLLKTEDHRAKHSIYH